MTDLEKAEALAGGAEITVIKRDKSVEQVKVKQLPVRLMNRYAAALQDEGAMVALLTGKDDKWVDSLSNGSFVQIVEEGDRLNEYFFVQWLERQRVRLKRVAPGILEETDASQTTSANSVSPPDSIPIRQ